MQKVLVFRNGERGCNELNLLGAINGNIYGG